MGEKVSTCETWNVFCIVYGGVFGTVRSIPRCVVVAFFVSLSVFQALHMAILVLYSFTVDYRPRNPPVPYMGQTTAASLSQANVAFTPRR